MLCFRLADKLFKSLGRTPLRGVEALQMGSVELSCLSPQGRLVPQCDTLQHMVAVDVLSAVVGWIDVEHIPFDPLDEAADILISYLTTICKTYLGRLGDTSSFILLIRMSQGVW